MKDSFLKLLGLPAKDKVTGFKGIVTSLSFDLFGCVQVVLTPETKKGGTNIENGHWLDVTRLKILSETPVMELPDFSKGYVSEGKKGCSLKSLPN